ncbi:MAG: hypothetical protein IBX47_03005 [Desulfuromonadales bacterium]|nr:hypothetical protein [Desulfuromonadales bacterium]
MRKFANLFFTLYLVDAVVSFLHELSAAFLQTSATSTLRNLIAVALLLLALPLYISLGIDRRLPKTVIIPQTLFIVWMALGAWPIANTAGLFGLFAAAIQILLGLLPFILYAGTAGSNRLLPEERFLSEFFALRNTLLFFLLQIIFLPLFAAFMVVSVVAQYADQGTAGFMRLGSDGIYMEERSYSRAGKTIRLAGMIHVGEKDFYHDLTSSKVSGKTVILLEGVTDQDHLLTVPFDYGEVAKTLGLTSQSEVEFAGRMIDADDLKQLGAEEFVSQQPHLIRADSDLNRFSPETIELLNRLGTQFLNNDSLPQGLQAYDSWARENVTAETMNIFMTDILHSRNEIVIAWLDQVLPLYDSVVIPWGALHMPGIEAAILERDFKLTSAKERLSLDFSAISFLALLADLSEKPEAGLDENMLQK